MLYFYNAVLVFLCLVGAVMTVIVAKDTWAYFTDKIEYSKREKLVFGALYVVLTIAAGGSTVLTSALLYRVIRGGP